MLTLSTFIFYIGICIFCLPLITFVLSFISSPFIPLQFMSWCSKLISKHFFCFATNTSAEIRSIQKYYISEIRSIVQLYGPSVFNQLSPCDFFCAYLFIKSIVYIIQGILLLLYRHPDIHMWLYMCCRDRNVNELTPSRPSRSRSLTLRLNAAQNGAFLILPQRCRVQKLPGREINSRASSSRNVWKENSWMSRWVGVQTMCEKGNEPVADWEGEMHQNQTAWAWGTKIMERFKNIAEDKAKKRQQSQKTKNRKCTDERARVQ